jgi:YtkA-like
MMRVVGAMAAIACNAAFACGDPGDKLATGANYTIAYRTAPPAIKTGEHFAVDFNVCPVGKVAMPRTVRVDASMPEHRHGMNYKTTVAAKGLGRYRAEGLLFHMSGRWEIAFDVATGTATERITSVVVLQ